MVRREGTQRFILHQDIALIEALPTRDAVAEKAASIITNIVKKKPDAAITYATGNTMIPVYEKVATSIAAGEVSFARTKAFHLDEYYPCDEKEPHSFVSFLRKRVFEPFKVGIANEINGNSLDPKTETSRYNSLLHEQPIDLAILGIGPGGHIGFNERGTAFDEETHLTNLSEETVRRDQIERGQNSPKQAITQGIANILQAEQILVVAYGEEKGIWLHEALYGNVSTECPASSLRLSGRKVTVLIDELAASQL